MTIANPIYDVVFKYLMEDERCSCSFLSSLLKKEIRDVKILPGKCRTSKFVVPSVFNLSLYCRVKECTAWNPLVIEIVKTWIPSKKLSSRKYLDVRYEQSLLSSSEIFGKHNFPVLVVYLLGHEVGDVEESVVYKHSHPYDYDGRLVEAGIRNPFIDSLTYDSVIVQIPRIKSGTASQLDKILSIFRQTSECGLSRQTLDIDDVLYTESDEELRRIIFRLLMASTDANIRNEMTSEDLYYSVIENRDTEILTQDKVLAGKGMPHTA